MAKMYDGNLLREMTPEEVKLYGVDEEINEQQENNALNQMVMDISNATTIEQLRMAAKKFLENSGEV